jgi:ribosomal protein L9
MEIILKEDVQNLGFKDDIVSVKNGHPKRLKGSPACRAHS